jgi:nucleoside phosphorylase
LTLLIWRVKKGGEYVKTGRRAGVLISFEREIERFETLLHGVRRLRVQGANLIRGSLGELEVHLFCTGIGRFSETEWLLKGFELLVSTGICGGLSRSLRCGDVVVAEKIYFGGGLRDLYRQKDDKGPIDIPESCIVYGLLKRALSSKPYQIVRGCAVTVEKPLLSTEEKKEVVKRTGGISVDMEDFYRLAIARKLGIPFVSIRAVYDDAKEDVFENPSRLDEGRITLSAGSIADALQAVLSEDLNFT